MKVMLLRFAFLVFFALACSVQKDEDGGNPNLRIDCENIKPTREVVVELTPEKLWLNTGIKLERGWDIIIEADDDRALGEEVVSVDNPVPFFGRNGLIFKVGEDGMPLPVPKRYAFSVGVEWHGKYLFVGWNTTEPLVVEGEVFGEEVTGEVVEPPEPITVTIKIFEPESDKVVFRPSLWAPADNFWLSESNPQFYWDTIDNAIRYKFQISDFEDFRHIIYDVELVVGGAGALAETQPQQVQTAQLQEGVYFWRVRAQINVGRSLNPIPVWTCWSYPFRLGVELGTPPAPPEFISPTTNVFSPGSRITFEFTVEDDPSFVFWRFRHEFSDCDEQPTINPNDPEAGDPTPWHIFRRKLGSGSLVSRPRLIASWTSPELQRGNHLFRLEVIDGESLLSGQEIRSQFSDFRVSVGCEEAGEQNQTTEELYEKKGTCGGSYRFYRKTDAELFCGR